LSEAPSAKVAEDMKIKDKKKNAGTNPRRGASKKARIVVDAVTGLPVLTAGPDAPS